MTDITKCKGEGCPIKSMCRRYTAPTSTMQSYLLDSPYDKDRGECLMFWGNASDLIFNQVHKIITGTDEDVFEVPTSKKKPTKSKRKPK